VFGSYRLDRLKSRNAVGADDDDPGEDAPKAFDLTVLGASSSGEAAAQRSATIAAAANWARDLANTPGNMMYPEKLAEQARKLAAAHDHLSVTVLEHEELRDKGMGLISGVGQGSSNPPRMIVLEWNPPGAEDADADRLALVGKAVTFDTGGISLKPPANMADMRLDKSGGCAVLGTMRALAELGVPRRVVAVVGAAENMPSGRAYKPGDVLTAYDGTTVEVTNTDAEGRLVLGDCISYARELGCGKIVEMSTLTGAILIALGEYFAGCIARKGKLTDAVLAAAEATGDHAWHLPMHDAYKSSLRSDIADMANSGPRLASSIYAGLFLEHFAKDTPFVHLDIAGAGMLSKVRAYYTCKGSSGYGVRLCTELAASH
jgi:leucyl aminopeptidase